MVRITVGNQTQVTSIKERTGYPVFEEVLNFMLFNPKLGYCLNKIIKFNANSFILLFLFLIVYSMI